MAPRHLGKTPGMEQQDENQEPEEPATGGDDQQPEPPAKVTLEDVSRLSPEHAPEDPDG
ncbi:MAG: hypothetical protein M3P50_01445 [Actinomycetota bacterium]|nr:hypothetical protein [Actinomycetota bacterium]